MVASSKCRFPLVQQPLPIPTSCPFQYINFFCTLWLVSLIPSHIILRLLSVFYIYSSSHFSPVSFCTSIFLYLCLTIMPTLIFLLITWCWYIIIIITTMIFMITCTKNKKEIYSRIFFIHFILYFVFVLFLITK